MRSTEKSGPSEGKKFCINFHNFFSYLRSLIRVRWQAVRPARPGSARIKPVKRSLMLFHIYHPRNHIRIIFSLVCSRQAIVCIDNDDLLCSLVNGKKNKIHVFPCCGRAPAAEKMIHL